MLTNQHLFKNILLFYLLSALLLFVSFSPPLTLRLFARAYRTVSAGDRIAQLVITPYITADFEERQELSETERGEGGFGSTGRR